LPLGDKEKKVACKLSKDFFGGKKGPKLNFSFQGEAKVELGIFRA
jgi:hypothetical protein